MEDMNGKKLIDGSIIGIHQTVNGQNEFIIISVIPLDIRYAYDINRKYEYNKNDLLRPCRYSGEVDWEIIGNINN